MKTLIIAEAGVNHNGSMTLAKELIECAKYSGADCIKFQTFITELNISKNARKAEYQSISTLIEESQFEMVKKLELSFNQFRELNDYCKKIGIAFLSTGFDYPSIDFIKELTVSWLKVPSGEITNKPFLNYVAKQGMPIILSTGMADMEEVRAAVDVLTSGLLTRADITVLHCNTEYPTPMEDVNLKAMLTMGSELGVKVGYSDHTEGIEVPIAAVALGATVIEKHFTLDRTLPGPDHRASLEPDELKAMVKAIRNVELALKGTGLKRPSPSETKNIAVARKSIHVKHDLPAGHVITDDDLIALRPGDGISPMNWETVLGKRLSRPLPAFTQLSQQDLL